MEKAERYVEGVGFEEFVRNPEKQDAVWNVSVMGEAAKQLDSERTAYDHIPWDDTARMRDRIVHGYFSIDLEILWRTVTERIPEAKRHIRRMLDEEWHTPGDS
jgi:uncharacterized protein with HEPN domain